MSVIMKSTVNLCAVLAVFSLADALTFPRKADLISRSSFLEDSGPLENYYDPFTVEAFGVENDPLVISSYPTLDPTYFYPDPSIPLVDGSVDGSQDMFAQNLDSSWLLLPPSEEFASDPSASDPSWIIAWRGSGRIDENESIGLTSTGEDDPLLPLNEEDPLWETYV